MSTAVHADSEVRRPTRPASTAVPRPTEISAPAERCQSDLRHLRARCAGAISFPAAADRRRLPPDGEPRHQHGRTYTPRRSCSTCRRAGLRVMVGLRGRNVAFLDDRALKRTIRRELAEKSRSWAITRSSRSRWEREIRWAWYAGTGRCASSAAHPTTKAVAGEPLTYVNFPPTEFRSRSPRHLRVQRLLHREHELRLPRAPAAHRRAEAAAARRSGGRQPARRQGQAGSRRCTSRRLRGRKPRRDRVRID